MREKLTRIVEWLLLASGASLLVVFAAGLFVRSVLSQAALAQFDEVQAAAVLEEPSAAQVDTRFWSQKRIRSFHETLAIKIQAPLAVVRIDRLGIRVPVLPGTSEFALNRGAGWIESTARPGAAGGGNIGIAGHRDGFFQGLKDIQVGDAIELSLPELSHHYVVDSLEIVSPENVGVLRPRETPSLTLVTCYPFNFVGNAPKRFIVHAARVRQAVTTQSISLGLNRIDRPYLRR